MRNAKRERLVGFRALSFLAFPKLEFKGKGRPAIDNISAGDVRLRRRPIFEASNSRISGKRNPAFLQCTDTPVPCFFEGPLRPDGAQARVRSRSRCRARGQAKPARAAKCAGRGARGHEGEERSQASKRFQEAWLYRCPMRQVRLRCRALPPNAPKTSPKRANNTIFHKGLGPNCRKIPA
jgi:hypothetical protein